MKLVDIFKKSFTQPTDLLAARKTSWPKTLLYFLMLSVILSLPLTFSVVKMLNQMQKDFVVITDKLPEFSIAENKLVPATKEQGFIYLTDYMIFTFDPEGKHSDEDIQGALLNENFAVALLEDKFLIALPKEHPLANMLGKSILSYPYSKMSQNSFSKTSLVDFVTSVNRPLLVIPSALLTILQITAINFIVVVMIITLMANLQQRLLRGHLRFGENFKLVVFSATLPVVVSTLISLVLPTFNETVLIILLTYFIYLRITRETKPPLSL